MEVSAARLAADLKWLQDCPDLIQSDQSFVLDHDAASSDDFQPVERFLQTKAAHRVGYYVESLFQSWLESSPDVSNLEHSIQIRREKETLGELDFLFRRRGVLEHLEVALKFYLCYPDAAANGSQFVGPNATDSFERKRDRLLNKQLPFGKEFFPEIQRSFHSIKGMIFYHWSGHEVCPLPDQLNSDHARGTWLWQRELEPFLETWSSAMSARVLKKPFWLAAHGSEQTSDELLQITQDHFERWDGPVFVALFEGGQETGRVFIMPDFWPAKGG